VRTSLLIGSAEFSDVPTSLTYPFPRRSPECALAQRLLYLFGGVPGYRGHPVSVAVDDA
jgi:hypothetical protein